MNYIYRFSPYRTVNTVWIIKIAAILYREVIAVCSESRKRNTNALCGQNVEIFKC